VNNFFAASAVKTYNSAAAEPFMNGSNTAYVEEMYNAWLRDPTTVHAVSSCCCRVPAQQSKSIRNAKVADEIAFF